MASKPKWRPIEKFKAAYQAALDAGQVVGYRNKIAGNKVVKFALLMQGDGRIRPVPVSYRYVKPKKFHKSQKQQP